MKYSVLNPNTFLVFLLIALIPFRSFAGKEDVITEHKQVTGNCEQCKTRIENAAYIKGVKFASWDADKQDLTIKFDTTKTNVSLILQNVAKAGHDNEMYKATDEDYKKLPKCCKYKSTGKH